jgi:hypothetical protein
VAVRVIRQFSRLLRSPRTIVVEVVAIIVAIGLSTLVPQRIPEPERWAEFARGQEALAGLCGSMGLDAVVQTRWFLGLVLLAFASLLAVQSEQWPRFLRGWSARPPADTLEGAPLRREWTRLAGSGPPGRRWTAGRMAALGSPVFHAGLLVVLLAGIIKMLAGSSAQVDLLEGETLPAGSSAWGAQWPGRLGRQVGLDHPMKLVRIDADRYPSGALRALAADVTFWTATGSPGEEAARLAVNAPFDVGSTRLHLAQSHGPAALLELDSGDGAGPKRLALLLRRTAAGGFEAYTVPEPGREIFLRATGDEGSFRASSLDVRMLWKQGLVFTGIMEPGSSAALEGGGSVRLVGLTAWARVNGGVDPSRPIVYVGMVLMALGAALMLMVVRVDAGVLVEPCGERERVVVAMRPRRFVPLYREEFERLVASERASEASGVREDQPAPKTALAASRVGA